MGPRRTRARKPPVTPDPKQRSIADFFSSRPSASRSPSTTPSKPRASPLRPTPTTSDKPCPPVYSPALPSPPSLPALQHPNPRTSSCPRPFVPTPAPSQCKSRSGPSIHDDLDISMAVELEPSPPVPSSFLQPAKETMDVDSAFIAPDDDPPLTQEELDVHDQLQALECSRDGPEPADRHSSPPKRISSVMTDGVPKRKRSAETAFAADLVSTPGPLSAAGYMFDSDDEATPPGLKSGPSPSGTTASGGDDDSDDDDVDAELRKYEEAATVRRSSRISKDVVRFDPDANCGVKPRGASVFGGSLFGDTRSSKAATSVLRAMMRERGAREREEKQIAEMRRDIAGGNEIVGEKETVFNNMAEEEQQREEQRLAGLEKYAAPIPLFTSVFKIPELKSKYLRKPPGQLSWNSLHHIMFEILKAGEDGDIALSLFAPCLAKVCSETESKDLFGIADIIFHLLIYDDTPIKPGLVSRDCLMDGIVMLCETKCVNIGQGRLPTLVAVLESYGAIFEDSGVPEVYSTRPSCAGSLDASAEMDESSCDTASMAKAVRNLKRAFLLAAERIRLNDRLYRVVSRKVSKKDKLGSMLYSLGVCVRTMLSVFGTRLHREVGDVIAVLLLRVDQKLWPDFRITAARYILSITSRLGLHVEMVTYLLPYTNHRARGLALDVGYLSLVQWSTGPSANPQPKDIGTLKPSAMADSAGIEDVSFSLGDLVEIAKGIPEMQKSTDIEWACGIIRMLKQTLADRMILDRREKGEIRTMHQILTKLRSCSHRLTFGLPVQDMRLALDALLLALRELLSGSISAITEISPSARIEKIQTRLSGST